jgi:phosphohistidine phosphatase
MMESLFQRYHRLLYLVRHGQAIDGSEDPARPLSDWGRETVEQMADWAARVGVRVERIEHSGKLRARQTAELFADRLQPPRDAAAVEGLRPNDSAVAVALRLDEDPCSRMLVGHLPQLERLISLLATKDADLARVRLDPASVAILASTAEGWTLLAIVPPDLVLK